MKSVGWKYDYIWHIWRFSPPVHSVNVTANNIFPDVTLSCEMLLFGAIM